MSFLSFNTVNRKYTLFHKVSSAFQLELIELTLSCQLIFRNYIQAIGQYNIKVYERISYTKQNKLI